MLDVLIPIAAFLLVINSAYHLRDGIKRKDVIELVVGIIFMALSIWDGLSDSQNFNTLSANNDSLIAKTDTLIAQRELDRHNYEVIEKYLKDTFNVKIVNNSPVRITYNTITQANTDNVPNNSDSLNYVIEIRPNDTIALYPKTGGWSVPYIGLDATVKANTDTNYPNYVENWGANPEMIKIKGKFYSMTLWKIFRSPSKYNPFLLNKSLYKNQYIIFGDQSAPTKRYAYKNGVVTWIPE